MRPFPAVLAFTICALLTPAAAGQSAPLELEVNGVRFGPSVKLEGQYFTNWENSLFTECEGAACETAANDAAVMCQPSACEDLEARIKALNGDHDRSANFTVVFQARRSMEKTAKRFLNDREDKIFLERIDRFELIPQ